MYIVQEINLTACSNGTPVLVCCRQLCILHVVSFCYLVSIALTLTEENRDMLDRSGFYKKFGKEWLFPTLQDAVELAKSGSSLLQVCHSPIVDMQ